jgi:hypothetical protein
VSQHYLEALCNEFCASVWVNRIEADDRPDSKSAPLGIVYRQRMGYMIGEVDAPLRATGSNGSYAKANVAVAGIEL